MVNLKCVTKTHKNGTTALKRVSLTIEDGEFVLINGHSGAGKSTIVHLLTVEDVPTFGDVIIDGVNTKDLSHRQIPKFRRTLGVVFQDFRLIPSMNVYDNIAFAMRAVGKRNSEIKKRVSVVMEIVGLKGKEKSFPDQLSGGEQQRVAIARAIVNSPKMIIADEPTGNIDPQMSNEVMQMLKTINDTGITVIVVTHEQIFAEEMGVRVITLSNGRIKSDTAHPEIAEERARRKALKAQQLAEKAEKTASEENKEEVSEEGEKIETGKTAASVSDKDKVPEENCDTVNDENLDDDYDDADDDIDEDADDWEEEDEE